MPNPSLLHFPFLMYINLLLLLFCYLSKAVCQQLTLALGCAGASEGAAGREWCQHPQRPSGTRGEENRGFPWWERHAGEPGRLLLHLMPILCILQLLVLSHSFIFIHGLLSSFCPLSFPCLACTITESLILEKIKSNLQLNTTMPSKPYHKVTHLLVFWTLLNTSSNGDSTKLPWAACSTPSVKKFVQIPNLNLPLVQLKATSPWPNAGCVGEEPSSHLECNRPGLSWPWHYPQHHLNAQMTLLTPSWPSWFFPKFLNFLSPQNFLTFFAHYPFPPSISSSLFSCPIPH